MKSDNHLHWHSRGYIPHFDDPLRLQFITFRLADSLPQRVLQEIARNLNSINPVKPEDQSGIEKRRQSKYEKYLSMGYGSCLLKKPQIATIVENSLLFFDSKRYRLLSWVVMPNHVHALIETYQGYPLHRILHSWKSFSAHKINKTVGRQGQLWQKEYFDRFIRNENHYWDAIEYIHQNPVKAGLVDDPREWRFGSARLFCENNACVAGLLKKSAG